MSRRTIAEATPRPRSVLTAPLDYRRPTTARNRARNSVVGRYARSLLRRLEVAARTGQLLKPMHKRKARSMAVRQPLTPAQRQLVERFAAGQSMSAVAKAARVPVLTIERVVRRALGPPGQPSRARGVLRTQNGVCHG